MNLIAAHHSWVQALGWSLVHFLWQGALVGILFALMRGMLANERSSARYLIGLTAMVILAVCPLLTFFAIWSPASNASFAMGEVIEVVPGLSTSTFAAESAMPIGWLSLLVAGWMSGVLLMIWRAVYQWRALERIASRLAWREAEIEEMLIRVGQRFRSLPGVRVLVSANIDTPTLIGWFKPVILLPAAVVIGFPREQLELILAHELGHLRRYDHLVNLGQAVIETLLFYHPVVHWISREVRHEREVCCDNLVLRLTDSEPQEYARTLAALESVRQLNPQLAVSASGGKLLDRVRRIVGSKSHDDGERRSQPGIWLTVAVCSIVIASALLVTPSKVDDPAVASASVIQIETAPFKPLLGLEKIVDATSPLRFAASPFLAKDSTQEVGTPDRVRGASDLVTAATSRTVERVATPVVSEISTDTIAPMRVDVMPLALLPAEIQAPQTVEKSDPRPRLVRQISPDYPESGSGSQHSNVDFEFTIDRRGNVRNIRVAAGDAQGAFAFAARKALQLWKFDPLSVSNPGGEKFRQKFEFVSKSYVARSDAGGPCTPPIGSHVCRPGRGFDAVKAASEKSAAEQAQALAEHFQGAEDFCQPSTGTRFCRSGSGASVALKVDPDQATVAHTIVLAGGSN